MNRMNNTLFITLPGDEVRLISKFVRSFRLQISTLYLVQSPRILRAGLVTSIRKGDNWYQVLAIT